MKIRKPINATTSGTANRGIRGLLFIILFVAFYPHLKAQDVNETLALNPLRTYLMPGEIKEPEIQFTIPSPANVPSERRVIEIFPLRNYIFFEEGSTRISDRYVLLSKDQVIDFREDQLEWFKPEFLSGRSDDQMIAYYNILNILGDRMAKKIVLSIILSGASVQGAADGKAMAESVKSYLVNTFVIAGSRITTEGHINPIIASEQTGGTTEMEMLRQGERRVSIMTNNPHTFTKFQNREKSPLGPVVINTVWQPDIDSCLTFNVDSADQEGIRFSVIFEFNHSDTKVMFENYLSEVVTPCIPAGAVVLIHGHTDIIGDELNNMTLSRDRALTVKTIIEKALAKAGRTDVIFEAYGYGEDEILAPFRNILPEERFYNRTVIIDVLPQLKQNL